MISDGEVTHDLGITLKGQGGAGGRRADADIAAGEVDVATRRRPLGGAGGIRAAHQVPCRIGINGVAVHHVGDPESPGEGRGGSRSVEEGAAGDGETVRGRETGGADATTEARGGGGSVEN